MSVKKAWNAFKEVTTQYLLNTALHGCRHLAPIPSRHWSERIIWIVALAVCVYGCITIASDFYLEYLNMPIVMSLASTRYPIWNVPFPTVAFCPNNKISYEAAKQLARKLASKFPEKQEEEWLKLIGKMGKLFVNGWTTEEELQMNEFQVYLKNLTNNEAYLENTFDNLLPSCDRLMIKCRWDGKIISCPKFFQTTVLQNGRCCIFNNDRKKIKKSRSPGHRLGLSVLLTTDIDDYFVYGLPAHGTQVLIYDTVIQASERTEEVYEGMAIPGTELFYPLLAFTKFSSRELTVLSPEERQCNFKEEHNVSPADQCISLCYIKFLQNSCNCTPFYLNQTGNSTKVCNLSEMGCITRTDAKFRRQNDCMCWPPCTWTWYSVHNSFGNLITPTLTPERFQILKNVNLTKNHSVVHLFFPNIYTSVYKRDILQSKPELLSNLGGIISLFSGFSFLTMVEIVYFSTVRFILKYLELQSQTTLAVKSENTRIYWNELLAASNKILK